MASRFRVARLGALVAVVLAALLATASPAAAQVTGKFIGKVGEGHGIKMRLADGTLKTNGYGALYGIKLDGSDTVLKTYCVEISVEADPNAWMIERPWSQFPGEHDADDPAKILWVLHHSYPNLSVAELGQKIGKPSLTEAEAITGTQAAVWHFANDANLEDESYPNVSALYAYLTGDENTGITEQPPASLTIEPGKYEDLALDAKAGPFTIDTNAATVKVVLDGPAGVQIVDKDGAEITEFTQGTEFWLTAPDGEEGGTATVKAEVQANVEKARLFVGNNKIRTQSLIVATSDKGKAKAEVTASWKKSVPPPTTTSEVPPTTTEAPPTTTDVAPTTTVAPPPQGGNLPNTGSTILPVLGVGLLLLGAGVGLVLLQRRRRTTS